MRDGTKKLLFIVIISCDIETVAILQTPAHTKILGGKGKNLFFYDLLLFFSVIIGLATMDDMNWSEISACAALGHCRRHGQTRQRFSSAYFIDFV